MRQPVATPTLARLLWSWAGVPRLVLALSPLAALGIQTRYRIPGPYIAWILPWIGVALSALGLLFFVNRLMAHSGGAQLRAALERFERWSLLGGVTLFGLGFLASSWLGSGEIFSIALWAAFLVGSTGLVVYAARVTATMLSGALRPSLRALERANLLLVVAFVGHGAVALVNGVLDFAPPVDKPSQVVAIERTEVDLGRFVPVSWADLRSWRGPGLERIFLHERERARTWPGQAILVRVHRGALGIPWVSRVTRDDEVHYRKILEALPTATAPYKRLVGFYLERQRWDEATAVALAYLKRYPGEHDYVSGVGARLGVAGRAEESIRLLESVIALEPESWSAHYHLGYAYLSAGRLPDAVVMFEKALERRPGHHDVEQQLRHLRARLGQPAQTATR
jgi:hypothetical protein